MKGVKHGLVLLVMISDFIAICTTLCRGHSKTPIPSWNVDQKSLETEFSISICRHTGDKWQSKTVFLLIFDPRLWIVDRVFDCHLSDVRIDFITAGVDNTLASSGDVTPM